MLYPECMIIVTIRKWHQFSSYKVPLKRPAVSALDSTEFREKKRNLLPTVEVPSKDCLFPGLDKTLLSILSGMKGGQVTEDASLVS